MLLLDVQIVIKVLPFSVKTKFLLLQILFFQLMSAWMFNLLFPPNKQANTNAIKKRFNILVLLFTNQPTIACHILFYHHHCFGFIDSTIHHHSSTWFSSCQIFLFALWYYFFNFCHFPPFYNAFFKFIFLSISDFRLFCRCLILLFYSFSNHPPSPLSSVFPSILMSIITNLSDVCIFPTAYFQFCYFIPSVAI